MRFLRIRNPRFVAFLAALGPAGLTTSCGRESGEGTATGHGGAAPAEAGPAKGPHGGRLLSEGDFQIEVTIYESGVPPEFRVYAFEAGKPLDPGGVNLVVEVHRLGGRVVTIAFQKTGDYLRGDKEIYEPHSFDVKAVAEHKGKAYRLGYAQVEARAELGPEARKNAGVEIEEAGPATMKNVLELSGEIALNPDTLAHVVPRFDGVVTEIRKNLGDKVSRGDVIAVIDSRELAATKVAYVLAVHKLEFARASFDRAEQLWKNKISPEEEYLSKRQALKQAQLDVHGSEQTLRALGLPAPEVKALGESHEENLARYELRAPLDGVVIEKNVALGAAVQEDTDIFTIADLGVVLAKLTIHGNDLKFIRTGQEVGIRSDTLELETSGKVAYVGPLIGKESRTAQAHVRIPNPEGLWRPGLFVSARLVQEEFTVPVAVRAEALQTLRDWEVVFIQDGDLFEACPLELGRRSGDWVEVRGGLTSGMKYVAKNSFLIKADILKSGASHDH